MYHMEELCIMGHLAATPSAGVNIICVTALVIGVKVAVAIRLM